MTRMIVVLVLLVGFVAFAQSEPFIVKIGCRDETLTVDPNRIDALILRGSGRVVEWTLETDGCPATARYAEIHFDRSSPFGETPADRELLAPELPEPPPQSVELLRREIFLPGEHRYRVVLLDADRNVVAKGEGRISARVIAPAMSTWGVLFAGIALAALFWGLRRRLWA